MMNMQNMMKQAQKMQKQMQETQAEIDASIFTGTSAQELVTVKVTGNKQIQSINIQSDIIDPEDADTLQDLIADAINSAMAKIDETTQQKLGKFANLPF